MKDQEIILLGDLVVYRDDLKGSDEIGVVTNTCISNFKVLWNDETNSRPEIYERLRVARLDEVDAQCRMIRKDLIHG